MQDMPRPRPPHLHRQQTRHGKAVWYVRIGKGPRVRIRAEFGLPEFHAEYDAAIRGERHGANVRSTRAGSLHWLIERSLNQARASRFGPKKMLPPTRRIDRLERGSAFGSPSCFIPAFAVAMPCGSGASMYAMER